MCFLILYAEPEYFDEKQAKAAPVTYEDLRNKNRGAYDVLKPQTSERPIRSRAPKIDGIQFYYSFHPIKIIFTTHYGLCWHCVQNMLFIYPTSWLGWEPIWCVPVSPPRPVIVTVISVLHLAVLYGVG